MQRRKALTICQKKGNWGLRCSGNIFPRLRDAFHGCRHMGLPHGICPCNLVIAKEDIAEVPHALNTLETISQQYSPSDKHRMLTYKRLWDSSSAETGSLLVIFTEWLRAV